MIVYKCQLSRQQQSFRHGFTSALLLEIFCDFFHPHHLIYTKGTAAAMNTIVGMLGKPLVPEDRPALVKKIGKATYKVRAHFRTISTETMSDNMKRMLKNEVLQM